MMQKEINELVSEEIKEAINAEIARLKSLYNKIIGGLVVVILLQTGGLIYGQAVDRTNIGHNSEVSNENKEDIKNLTETINNFALSVAENSKTISETTIENKTRLDEMDKHSYNNRD